MLVALPSSISREAASGNDPSWLAISNVKGGDMDLGMARLYIAWQYTPNSTGGNPDFEERKNDVSWENLAAPTVRPGKLMVKVLEAKNLRDPGILLTADPVPEVKLLPGNEVNRRDACEDGAGNPHWDWSDYPAWTYLVEDASVTSMEVSIYNEKTWFQRKVSGSGLMGSATITMASDILQRGDNISEPTQKWYPLRIRKGLFRSVPAIAIGRQMITKGSPWGVKFPRGSPVKS